MERFDQQVVSCPFVSLCMMSGVAMLFTVLVLLFVR